MFDLNLIEATCKQALETGANAPAWVQAIGSVLAIAAITAVHVREYKLQIKRDEREREMHDAATQAQDLQNEAEVRVLVLSLVPWLELVRVQAKQAQSLIDECYYPNLLKEAERRHSAHDGIINLKQNYTPSAVTESIRLFMPRVHLLGPNRAGNDVTRVVASVDLCKAIYDELTRYANRNPGATPTWLEDSVKGYLNQLRWLIQFVEDAVIVLKPMVDAYAQEDDRRETV